MKNGIRWGLMGITVVILLVLAARETLTAADGPAPMNPFKGRSDREELFAFARNPEVEEKDGKYVISFASKATCDATVAVVDKDGKIVRHIASGVLGPNAPWPFQQDSLEQSIEWDGTDDRGKPVPVGCRVSVGLGLKADLDRVIGWEPRAGRATGLVCDADGNLYVIKSRSDPYVQVYDREGRYMRTLAPFPSTLPPEKATFTKFVRTTDGRTVPASQYSNTGGGVHTLSRGLGMKTQGSIQHHMPVITPDGRELFFVTPGYRSPRYLLRMGTDGSLSADSMVKLNTRRDKEVLVGSWMLNMAVSPDGEWLYFGSSPDKPSLQQNAVWRKKLSELKPPADKGKKGRALAPEDLFLGEIEPGKSGNDETHFNGPRGVACDADGNLYVADCGNNRIQVFDKEGRFLRSLPVERPDRLCIHPKTGDIYLLPLPPSRKGTRKFCLIKLDKEGKKRAEFQVQPIDYRNVPVFCVDASGDEPAVWIQDGNGLRKMADRGGAFELVLDVGDEIKKKWPKGLFPRVMQHCYIAADPFREEIYLRIGGTCYGSGYIRADGRTGKIIDYSGEHRFDEMHFGPDGLAYVRAEKCGDHVVRFDPSTKKVVPFEKGIASIKDSRGRDHQVSFLGQATTAIDLPLHGGHTRTFQDGFCVAPNGDIYVVLAEAQADFWHVLRKIGQAQKMGKPGKGHLGGKNNFLQVYAPDGSSKHISALPGLLHSCGARVARNGNVYISLTARTAGQAEADGIAPKPFTTTKVWGALIRFNSAFNQFPVGRIHGTYETGPLSVPHTHERGRGGDINKLWAENMRWEYGGVLPSTSMSKVCVCGNSRFDLDRFERAFVPAMQTFSVNVLDANGNLIKRIGTYGNADSRGKDSPVVDPKTGRLRPKRPDDPTDLEPPEEILGIRFRWAPYVAVTDEALYAHDMGNYRVLRCALGYEIEETAAIE